jgi:hypothetical protein
MMLITELKFISTFVLKPSNVTNTSGRTLLLPTPFAIKTALTDRAIVRYGYQRAEELFPSIRDLKIFWSGPAIIGVTQTRERGIRLEKSVAITQLSIQEYCWYSDSFYLALDGIESANLTDNIAEFLRMLFYLGRSSSIVNCEYVYTDNKIFDPNWVKLFAPLDPLLLIGGVVQRMDDMRDDIELKDISAFRREKFKKARIQYDIVVPYRLASVAKDFVVYEKKLQ